MGGLFGTMGVGVKALSASQLALNVTSQNISNANTEGYSRKRLNLSSEYRRDPAFGQMGFGVEVNNVSRIRDFFIDKQINSQTTELNYNMELDESLQRLENIFGEPAETSISKVLEGFWDSWGDLANNPESIAAREVVVANSNVLADTFHNISGEIRDLRDSKNDDIAVVVSDVNQYLSTIYQLNKEISVVELSSNGKANDTRDQRDLAIKNLSALINVTTEDAGNGVISVLTNGNMLVSPSSFITLEVNTVSSKRYDGTSYQTVGVRFSSTKKNYEPQSGKLKGMMDARDLIIPSYEDKLDEMANEIVNEINALHREGYSLNGTSGIDFFKVNNHEENVSKHVEVVKSHTFAFDPLNMPYTRDLGTPNIDLTSMVVKDSNGLTYATPADYIIDSAAGTITLVGGALAALPAPPLTPNLVLNYSYGVPKGTQTKEYTYASNIELSAAIKSDVINIAASGGTTSRAYADSMIIPAVGNYEYVHLGTGIDGMYGTADDLREESSIVKNSLSIRSGGTTLIENEDYHVKYSTGEIILLNAAYAGASLNMEYETSVPGSAGIGDNSMAVEISELRHTKVMVSDVHGNETATINSFYSAFIGKLGVERNEFTTNVESRQFLVQQFEAKQAEIAGVSLDEEMANLIKFQHTYQASARVISTVEKMLDILLNL